MTKLAIAINTARCIDCMTCANACKMQNNVPDGMLWNRVITEGCSTINGAEGTYPNLSRTFLPLACQHCENPACQKVCPTGATYKDDKGRVEIDYDKCIGCRMCMAACPYNARTFNWAEPRRSAGFSYGDSRVPERKRGVMEKCTLCKERTDDGTLYVESLRLQVGVGVVDGLWLPACGSVAAVLFWHDDGLFWGCKITK